MEETVRPLPFFALLLAYLLLGETLIPWQWLASGAVLAGIVAGQLPMGRGKVGAVALADG